MSDQNNASTSKKYKKLTQHEHILKCPGMYIGSVTEDVYDTWVYNDEDKCMIKKNTKFVPGLYKIFDEIAVNSLDQIERLKQTATENTHHVKEISVTIDLEENSIAVMNSGDGLDILKHDEHDIYIPELVFGNLLTSTNYDEKTERTIGGMNGLGAKTVNIFSKKFIVETIDATRELYYYQEFSDNMHVKSQPIIKKSKKYPYTKITFIPDYEKFNMKGLEDDILSLFYKRTYDICGLTDNSIKVSLNNTKLTVNNFEKYADLYLNGRKKIYEEVNDRWKIIISYSETGFEQVSFVNGISTMKGGKHVDYVVNTQLVKKMTEALQKKYKDVVFKPQHIKDNLFIFINATIGNPSFDSQTKDCLTTPASKFGSKCELSKQFITKLMSFEITERIYESATASTSKLLKKTDGKKQSNIKGIPKLDDANWAGTNKSKECTLILTEGDSAKSMAISGLSVVGRDKFGVFPLRGKILNTLDTNEQKIAANIEITALKKIIGLESKKQYKNVNDLRYGNIMIMTDQDSVTFDTPCLVKHIETGLIDVKPICELNNKSWQMNENCKEYSICNDYLVWSDKGWTKIKGVMKHLVTKPIYRVLTHTGCVDVTEDHSLLDKFGNKIKAIDCNIKETELLHKKYIPDRESIEINDINEEYAYALGYFQADGSCGIDSKVTLRKGDKTYDVNNSYWSITCINFEPLERLKYILQKYECNGNNDEIVHQNKISKYQCKKCNKYFKDTYALNCHLNRKSDCSIVKKLDFEIVKKKFGNDAYSSKEYIYQLQAKVVRKGIATKYRSMFYNSLREKKIPVEILNASIAVQQSFINGFYAGDGNKGIRTTDNFEGEHKSQIMGLFQLLQNCGYTPSINCSSKKLNVYSILMSKLKGYNRPKHTVKKIINVSETYKNSYVYDFETENHHFHGSIGNMIVSNTDGLHILGLLFNMFNSMWPSLMTQPGFLTSMLTPVIKAKNKKQIIEFYNIPDYYNWKNATNQKGWEIKYYKGLGTSTNVEAKEYFREMKQITYVWEEDNKSAESLGYGFQ